MKDLRHESAKLLAQASSRLIQIVPSASFEFWQRKDFRLYIVFNTISQTEQDRIFNELELTILGLFILHLEHAILTAHEQEQKLVYSSFKNDLIPAFLQLFKDNGIEKKYINQWKVLIDMRLKEYREDFKTAIEETQKMTEFKGEEVLKIAWARVETLTIDCLTHIRRGKVEADDPLWKLLRKWIISVDGQLSVLTNR